MVHTFITRRIDYCNSLLQDVSEVHLRPLQNVLNSAVCIILWKQRLHHITADIGDLVHWLPVQQRIEYKMCVLIYKLSTSVNTSPSYASRLQQPPVRVIYVQQCKATSSSLTVGQSDMDKEVLPILDRIFGTHTH